MILKQEKEKILTLITKAKDEELRYARAYGEQALDFEQFKELTKKSKKKQELFQTQLDSIENTHEIAVPQRIDLDDICAEAQRVLQSLDTIEKIKVIRDVIEKVTIKGDGSVDVQGHIPLTTENMGDIYGNRHCRPTKCR